MDALFMMRSALTSPIAGNALIKSYARIWRNALFVPGQLEQFIER